MSENLEAEINNLVSNIQTGGLGQTRSGYVIDLALALQEDSKDLPDVGQSSIIGVLKAINHVYEVHWDHDIIYRDAHRYAVELLENLNCYEIKLPETQKVVDGYKGISLTPSELLLRF